MGGWDAVGGSALTDQELNRLAKIAIAIAIFYFWPQIIKGLRRIGFLDERQFDSTNWRRGMKLFGIAFLILIVGLIL